MPSKAHNSAYWKAEIERTQLRISELIHGETFDVQSAKSDTDTLAYQNIKDRLEALRAYLAYCENKYEEALQEEGGEVHRVSSILYFEREYGY